MDVKETEKYILLSTGERIDHFTAPQLDETFKQLLDNGHYHVVFDMSQIDFVSSAGWWVLIKAQKACKQDDRGEVVLVGLQEPIRESMNMIGIGQFFRQFDQLSEAEAVW